MASEKNEFSAGLPDLLSGRLTKERYRERLAFLLYSEEYTAEKTLQNQRVQNAEVCMVARWL